jgi:uncharacterized membrane protein YfcA
VSGAISGAIGDGAELGGQCRHIVALASATMLGAITGAVRLPSLPSEVFNAVVPVLIALALVLLFVPPRLARELAARRGKVRPHGGAPLWTGVFGTGIYGGYLGAASASSSLALLGITLPVTCTRLNALKNVLAAMVNGVAAAVFVFGLGRLAGVLLLAVGSAASRVAQRGKVGCRLSPSVLRGVIVAGGVAAIAQLVTCGMTAVPRFLHSARPRLCLGRSR